MRGPFLFFIVAAICLGVPENGWLKPLLKWMTKLTSTTQRRPFGPFSTRIVGDYMAPMRYCDDPERAVPEEYFVYLHSGYELEQHKQAIGADARAVLEKAITNTFLEDVNYGPYYAAMGLQNATLDAVRADIGVDLVQCMPQIYLIE